MAEKIFPKGLFAKKREGSPSFVVTSLNIKVPDFVIFLKEHENNGGFVNIDILINDNNTQYSVLNTWQPTKDNAKVEEDNQEKLNNLESEKEPTIDPVTGNNCDDIPF